MTITKFIAVAGKIIPDHKVFENVLNHCEWFRDDMNERIRDCGVFSLIQFHNFLTAEAPEYNNDEQWSEKVHDEMYSFYHDHKHELTNMKWTLESGSELDIFRITHDIDNWEPFVVGRAIDTFQDSISEISTEDVCRICGELNVENWKDTNIYIIQDDCACCS